MGDAPVIFSMFLIFTGAAVMATLALFTKQSLIVAYIVLGMLFGPSFLGWVQEPAIISQLSNIGIIFLLFLLGLNLHPQNLLHLLRKTMTVTILSSLLFNAVGYLVAQAFGYSTIDCLVVGAAMMFSSTIIGLKLLPTTVLHHQRMGEVVISILLLQDLIAIVVMLLLNVDFGHGVPYLALGSVLLALPALIVFCLAMDRYVLIPLLARFDRIQEYIFLLAIGWCLGISELAEYIGLSFEIGAFIAGVAIATSPIALYIAESLKPLRDFFLIIFFFALGAGFQVGVLQSVWLPALIIAGGLLLLKPVVFWGLLRQTKESGRMAREIGVRLGQVSEFSLMVAYVGLETKVLSSQAAHLIQATTIITFIVSSYYIVREYPTPIATREDLRRD